MGQDTHGVNKNKKFFLSNYSLTYQLFFINLLVSLIGFLALFIFNFYLIKNDKNIIIDYDNAYLKINKITSFLEKNSILRVPLFNENCENIKKNQECENFILSNPELEPTSTQQFIVQNFLNEDIDVKVYNDNWIKFADTTDIYITSEVAEIDLSSISKESINLFERYRSFYLDFFNQYRGNFVQSKFIANTERLGNEVHIVSETIKNKKIISKKFYNEENEIVQLLSSPIVNNDKVFGVVIISYPIISKNFNLGLTSFSLFNFYVLFVLIMLLLSFFFSGSIVRPIKQLSKLTLIERQKISQKKITEYPIRGDEIGSLSKEIQNMSHDLKSQIDQLEKFAADVSHELKNPLTSLHSANELLANHKIANHNKKLLINNMGKDIKRINRLISDIANYTKIKAEIETENFEYIKISEFLKDIVEQYNDNKKNIQILIESSQNNKTVLANRNKLSQVFYNLIDNNISILDKNKKILISLENKDDQHIHIKIYDQGKGIPMELAEKVFDRFYTDRDVNRNNHTGLGLSIVREIIRSFRGSIRIIKSDRIEYSGACFVINLPLRND